MTLWSRLPDMVDYAGGFLVLSFFLSLAACVWVYLDSHRFSQRESVAFLLATVVATFQICLFFIHPLYPTAFVCMLAVFILLGHHLPYAMRKCPVCGFANAVMALTCSHCGQVFRQATKIPQVCLECKRVYTGDERHCMHCGTTLMAYEPLQPGPRKDGGIVTCPVCGEKNVKWRTECWKCNKQLQSSDQV